MRATVTGGAAATPLVVLFAANLVDEFDRVAFGVLTPEIRDAFGLSDSGVVLVGSLAGVLTLVAALPIGVLADRVRRTRLAAAGAGAWGAMTVLTALAPTAVVLGLARIGAGIGRIVNEPVHASLLSDWYPPTSHPRVFAVHRLANPLGLLSALAVGALAAVWDWRAVFLLLAVPTFVLLPVLLRLPEPPRGTSVAPRAVVPFREARRRLFAVPTLRRLYVSMPVAGLAVIALPQLLSLFFERVHGFGTAGRGLMTFLTGAGILAGLLLGQAVATRAVRSGERHRLATCHGAAVVGLGAGLGVLAVVPGPATALVATVGVGVGVGAYQPAYYTLVAAVTPSHLRAQAYAWSILLLGGGALTSPLVAALGDRTSYRVALAVVATTLLAGGAVIASARGSVQADADAADAAAVAARPATEPLAG